MGFTQSGLNISLRSEHDAADVTGCICGPSDTRISADVPTVTSVRTEDSRDPHFVEETGVTYARMVRGSSSLVLRLSDISKSTSFELESVTLIRDDPNVTDESQHFTTALIAMSLACLVLYASVNETVDSPPNIAGTVGKEISSTCDRNVGK